MKFLIEALHWIYRVLSPEIFVAEKATLSFTRFHGHSLNTAKIINAPTPRDHEYTKKDNDT